MANRKKFTHITTVVAEAEAVSEAVGVADAEAVGLGLRDGVAFKQRP